MNAQKIVHLCGITTYLSHGKSGRGDFFFCVCVCVRLSIYHKFALVTQMTWALVVCSVTLSLCLFLLSTYSLFNALTWRFNSVCKHYIRVCVCVLLGVDVYKVIFSLWSLWSSSPVVFAWDILFVFDKCVYVSGTDCL